MGPYIYIYEGSVFDVLFDMQGFRRHCDTVQAIYLLFHQEDLRSETAEQCNKIAIILID